MNNEKFVEGMDILLNSGLKYQTKPNKKMLIIWYNFLGNIKDEIWLKIIKSWINTQTEFPTITELKDEYVKQIIEDIDIRSEVEKSQFGRGYIDPILREAIMKEGGFYRIGQMDDRDYIFAIKDIEKTYKELLKREKYLMLGNNQKQIGE